MSISLAGANRAQLDCNPHFWVIKSSTAINPKTGNMYGKMTPGTCTYNEEHNQGGCGLERVFNSEAIQHNKGELFSLTTPTE